MFLPPDQRSIPPRWEPEKPKPKRDPGNAATILIVLLGLIALLAPIGGGTVVAVVMMLSKRW